MILLEQMHRVHNEDDPMIVNVREKALGGRTLERLHRLKAVLAGMLRREEMFEYLVSLPPEAWERPFRHEEWRERKFYS